MTNVALQEKRIKSVKELYVPTERDYARDFPSENGFYRHICRICGQDFMGNKRRPSVCRTCINKENA